MAYVKRIEKAEDTFVYTTVTGEPVLIKIETKPEVKITFSPLKKLDSKNDPKKTK